MAAQTIKTNVQSVLAADFGSVNTRLTLIDLVNGQYRLVSRVSVPTTMDAPQNDVTIGLTRAVDALQAATGRSLVDGDGILITPEQGDGSGVDEIVATSSAARPLRAVLVGLMETISLQSAIRALNGTYIELAETVSISTEKSEEAQINAILQAEPDLIFIAGGTDGGNTDTMRYLIDVVSVAIRLFPPEKIPLVLYAGNDDLGEYAYTHLQVDGFEEGVFVAPNIRPRIDDESLSKARLELSMVYSNFVTAQPGGFRDISTVSKVGVVPTAQSIGNMIRWMGQLPQEGAGILHLDIGSSTSSLTVAFDGKVYANVQSDLGMGHSLTHTLNQIDIEAVLRWLPFPFTKTQLHNYAHNKGLNPSTIPQNTQDLFVEYAVAREIIRYLVRSEEKTWKELQKDKHFIPSFQPIIVSGATLTEAGSPAITAMLVLDALELQGITNVWVDPFSVLPALGAVALLEPTITVQVFENQALTNLGPIFSAENRPRKRGSSPAMRIKITLRNGRIIEHELLPGELWSAPISPGQEASVEVRLGRGLKIYGKGRIKRVVKAGVAGVIFDARGRSLDIPNLTDRPSTFLKWWSGLTEELPRDLERWAQDGFDEIPEDLPFENEVAALTAYLNQEYAPKAAVTDEESDAERRRRELNERISS